MGASAVSCDKYCVMWDDFESNLKSSFREFRQKSELFDIILSCDDGTDMVICSLAFLRIIFQLTMQIKILRVFIQSKLCKKNKNHLFFRKSFCPISNEHTITTHINGKGERS